MLPLTYAETGPYDSALDVRVEPDGAFEVVGGSYVSHRRSGRLAARETAALVRALAALAPDRHDPRGSARASEPPSASDFSRVLTWSAGTRRWRGPAPAHDAALATVLARLRRL